jgi:ribosomal protein S18 acetylase RimI-like enzyme
MTEIRALRPDDDRSGFRSGDPEIDRFFLRFAGQNQFRHHLGVTYVAVEGAAIRGFVTISAAQVESAGLPAQHRRNLPGYPLPALRISRLGVAETSKGRGIGAALLRFTFGLAQETADRIGCVGLVVDAKPAAIAFYERLGFCPCGLVSGGLGDRPMPTPMFLGLGSIPRPLG